MTWHFWLKVKNFETEFQIENSVRTCKSCSNSEVSKKDIGIMEVDQTDSNIFDMAYKGDIRQLQVRINEDER